MFKGDPADGILGLAYPSISQLKQNPWFNSALKAGVVSSGEFGFKLASSGSELYLGGTDSSLYSGSLEYHDIDTSSGFWQVKGGKSVVGSKHPNTGIDTIIDSGTTIMYGPTDDVKTFYAAIPGSKEFDSAHGSYSYPCDSLPTIGFSWGGKTWTITEDK